MAGGGVPGHEGRMFSHPFLGRPSGQGNVMTECETLFLLTGPGNISSKVREGLMRPPPLPEELLAVSGDGGGMSFFLSDVATDKKPILQ